MCVSCDEAPPISRAIGLELCPLISCKSTDLVSEIRPPHFMITHVVIGGVKPAVKPQSHSVNAARICMCHFDEQSTSFNRSDKKNCLQSIYRVWLAPRSFESETTSPNR